MGSDENDNLPDNPESGDRPESTTRSTETTTFHETKSEGQTEEVSEQIISEEVYNSKETKDTQQSLETDENASKSLEPENAHSYSESDKQDRIWKLIRDDKNTSFIIQSGNENIVLQGQLVEEPKETTETERTLQSHENRNGDKKYTSKESDSQHEEPKCGSQESGEGRKKMKTWHIAQEDPDHFTMKSGPEKIVLKGKLLPVSECEHGATYWKVSQSDCHITLLNGEQKIDLKGKLVGWHRAVPEEGRIRRRYKNEKAVGDRGLSLTKKDKDSMEMIFRAEIKGNIKIT